ncbi:hypothetical protein B1218_35650, partial [Pseudomonas ogarae]
LKPTETLPAEQAEALSQGRERFGLLGGQGVGGVEQFAGVHRANRGAVLVVVDVEAAVGGGGGRGEGGGVHGEAVAGADEGWHASARCRGVGVSVRTRHQLHMCGARSDLVTRRHLGSIKRADVMVRTGAIAGASHYVHDDQSEMFNLVVM